MSDLGTALSDTFSGMGGSLSGILSGVGNALAGTSGATSGAATPSIGGTNPVQTAQAITNTIDPTGSAAASAAINPPTAAGDSTGAVGGDQSDGSDQSDGRKRAAPAQVSADPTGPDIIRQLIAQWRGQGNPYQPGGTQQPNPVENWENEGGAPYRPPTPKPGLGVGPGKGGQFMPQWQGGEGQPPVDIPDYRNPPQPPAPDQAPAPDTAGPGRNITVRPRVPALRTPAPEWFDEGGPVAPDIPPQTRPDIGPGSAAASAGIPPFISQLLGRATPIGVAGAAMSPTPAETGELPYGGYTSPPGTTIAGPASEVLREGEGGQAPGQLPHDDAGKTPTKKEYEDWLKAQGDPPATAKKKADKSTPKERKEALPTKKDDNVPAYWVDDQGRKHPISGDLPTKKGGPPGERPYHMDEVPPGQSRMMRDVHGMQGVPQMLGSLAQLALALTPLLGGMGGGERHRHGDFRGFPFGRGGHGRFGGGPFHPGEHPGGYGSGMWPYHHPGMGWQGFGHHPGGEWRPWGGPGARFAREHDERMARRNAMMNQGGGDPNAQLLQALLGGGQQQQQQQRPPPPPPPQQGGPQGGGGGQPASATPTTNAIPGVGASEVDNFTRQTAQELGIDPDTASRVLSMESSYGQNYTGDGGTSFGPFQLHFAPDGNAMGDQFRRDTGLDPRNPATWKEQIRYALNKAKQGGWGPWQTTMGKLGYNQWTGINRQFAGNPNSAATPTAGRTPTGDSATPKPDRKYLNPVPNTPAPVQTAYNPGAA